ncbi:hypothetical protein GCM10025858_31700 [Alicyclobacillus sacchari]|nr:hypothetical protein GCM10025858_31700 [Alicyclobacillus sacchari]
MAVLALTAVHAELHTSETHPSAPRHQRIRVDKLIPPSFRLSHQKGNNQRFMDEL